MLPGNIVSPFDIKENCEHVISLCVFCITVSILTRGSMVDFNILNPYWYVVSTFSFSRSHINVKLPFLHQFAYAAGESNLYVISWSGNILARFEETNDYSFLPCGWHCALSQRFYWIDATGASGSPLISEVSSGMEFCLLLGQSNGRDAKTARCIVLLQSYWRTLGIVLVQP